MKWLPLRRHGLRLMCVAFVPIVAGGGCVSEPSAITGESRSYAYTWQQELELGAKADKDVVAEMGIYDNPELQSYVDQVAHRVLAKSDFRDASTPEMYRDTTFTFRVLDTPVVNAFALPGGFVYVTRGLLAHVDNEAQLAVVLGHEIGHVIARHSSRQALRAQWGQLGLLAGAIIGEKVAPESNLGSQILDLGGSAFQFLLLRYSRDAEREADSLGVKYAGLAGYAPAESASFFESLKRMSEAKGQTLPAWESTHPDPGERAKTVRESAGAWIPVGEQKPEVGTREFLDHVDGIVIGDDPRQGYRRGDTFYHPELKFQLPIPAGWKLQNEHAMVLLTAPDKSAGLGLQLAPGADPATAATQTVQQAGMQIADSRQTTIHGLPATIVLGDLNTDQGTVRTVAAFIGYQGRVFSLVGQAAPASFPLVQPILENAIRGFAPLDDPARLEVKPTRLKLVTAEHPGPFREFVPAHLPESWTPETLAIMNQVGVDETIDAGRRLKLPQ